MCFLYMEFIFEMHIVLSGNLDIYVKIYKKVIS